MSETPRSDRPLTTTKDVLDMLQGYTQQVDEALERMRAEIEQGLKRLEGKKFASYQASQRVVERLRAMLDHIRADCVCPKPGCGRPARPICLATKAGRVAAYIAFQHCDGGKYSRHGTFPAFPALQLVGWDQQESPRRRLRRRGNE